MSKNNINLSPEAKRELQRLRRKIARDQSRKAEAEMADARTRLRIDASNNKQKEVLRQGTAIMRNLVSLCRAVNSAFGVNLPVTLTPLSGAGVDAKGAMSPVAFTDYKSIVVKYPLPREAGGANLLYALDTSLLQRLVGEVKAFQYHELGHILFSTPIRNLFHKAQAQTEEAWVACHPNRGEWLSEYSVKRTHNILEDQRMETALVNESPYLARYLTLVVLNWILSDGKFGSSVSRTPSALNALTEASQYLLIVNRRYLPMEARRASRQKFVDFFGEADTVEAETIVREYCSADKEVDMVHAVFRFHLLLMRLGIIPPQMDDHWTFNPADDGNTVAKSADSKDKQAEDSEKIRAKSKPESKTESEGKDKSEGNSDGDSGKGDDEDDSDASDGDGSADGDDAGDNPDEVGSSGGAGGSDDTDDDADGDDADGGSDGDSSSDSDGDTPDTSDGAGSSGEDNHVPTEDEVEANNTLADLLNKSVDEVSAESDVMDTVRQINREMGADGDIPMEPETRVAPMSDDLRTLAEEIAGRMAHSFDSAVASALPVWEENHSQGMLNAFRYRTRNAGDHNYRRMLTSEGNTGMDIAVTIMLDVSGSMGHEGGNLGVSAWAIKTACERVGIDCTVVTFDHDSRELWRAEDKNVDPVVLIPNGGTNPEEAIRRLDDHRTNGQTYHLVVVLTDGMWSGDSSFTAVPSAGRVVLGVFLGSEYYVDHLMYRGCNEAVSISDLTELPEIVRNFLLKFLG